jgi:hypothetical protein
MAHPYHHAVSATRKYGGEQHVLEDLGRIPTVADWLGRIQPEPWMLGKDREQVSQ